MKSATVFANISISTKIVKVVNLWGTYLKQTELKNLMLQSL